MVDVFEKFKISYLWFYPVEQQRHNFKTIISYIFTKEAWFSHFSMHDMVTFRSLPEQKGHILQFLNYKLLIIVFHITKNIKFFLNLSTYTKMFWFTFCKNKSNWKLSKWSHFRYIFSMYVNSRALALKHILKLRRQPMHKHEELWCDTTRWQCNKQYTHVHVRVYCIHMDIYVPRYDQIMKSVTSYAINHNIKKLKQKSNCLEISSFVSI